MVSALDLVAFNVIDNKKCTFLYFLLFQGLTEGVIELMLNIDGESVPRKLT